MSAFVVHPNHVKALGIYAAGRTPGYGSSRQRVAPGYIGLPDAKNERELAETYANLLYSENVKSVNAHNPKNQHEDNAITIDSSDFVRCSGLPAINILAMLDCLEYQSCEHDGWPTSKAHDLLQRIRKAAIKALPGYDDAPWEFTGATKKAA